MFSWLKRLLLAERNRKAFDEQLNRELGEKYAQLERETDHRLPLDPGKSELR